MKKYYLIFLFLQVHRFCFSNSENCNKIVYLSDSSLYIFDLKTQSSVRFSPKKDKISDFIVSPDHKYIAFTKFNSYRECVDGSADDTTSASISSETPIYSIKIFDLERNKLLKEIFPLTNEFINLNKWISAKELLCSYGDCEVFDGWIKYTINDSIRKYVDGENNNHLNSIIGVSKDSEYNFYTDSLNVLHRYNFLSKTDLIFPNSKNTIIDSEQSDNKKFVSWLEVISKTKKDCKTGSVSYIGSIDRVILFSISDWKKTEIYSDDASRMPTKKYLTFSPNDSIITIETAKEIIFKNLYTSERFIIYGHNLGWINRNNFIYSNIGCIFQYDMRLKKSKLLINNSDLAYAIE